jgi:FtsH-binding integral membrane protein
MSNYTATVNSQNQVFVKKQASVLSKSLMVAGVAFILMFAFSLALYALLNRFVVVGVNDSALSAIYMISIFCILAVMIMSIFTMKGIDKMKLSTIITMIVLYGVGNGMAFGVLFYAIEQSQSAVSMIDIMTCFLLTGLIFGICGAIGTVLSAKFTMSLGKFLMVATFAFLGIYLILIIMSMFTSGIFGNGRTNILI